MICDKSLPISCAVPARDEALELIKGTAGWRHAVEEVVAVSRASWANQNVAIGFGDGFTCDGATRPEAGKGAATPWKELPLPSFTPGAMVRQNRPSPISDEIFKIAPGILQAPSSATSVAVRDVDGPCHTTLIVLISDGLHQETLSAKPKGAIDRMVKGIERLAAASPDKALAPVRLFFARAQPLSDKTIGDPLEGACEKMSGITANTLNLSKPICVEVDIDGAVSLSSLDYVKKSSENLKKRLQDYIDHVALDMKASCTATRYWAAQEGPAEPAEAVVTGNDSTWTCSGVVVDRDVVLTAAHCLPLSRVLVTEDVARSGTIHAVADVVRHPVAAVDAALVRTATRMAVTPARLRGATDTEAPEGILRFVGFGATSADGQSGFGHKHWIDLSASGWGCDGDRIVTKGCQPGREMVLAGSMGRDTCGGDSGGPVYELWGNGQECGYRVVGIVARRTADAVVPCGNGGIYTRVDAMRTWVDTVLADFRARSGAPMDDTTEEAKR